MAYDLIVVGGGILGTFHAYHAATRGLQVLVLEKDDRAQQATVRNFGQVVPSGMTGRWFEYGRRGLEIYKALQAKADLSVRQNGSVYIASDDDEQQLLHEVQQQFSDKDYAGELLSTRRLLQKYPVIRESYAREALFFPQEISVEPNLFIHRLQQYMQDQFANVRFLYNSAVVGCDSNGQQVTVSLAGGKKLTAGQLLICGGHEFNLLFPEVFTDSGIVVSKLQMMRTVAMPSVPLEGNILTGLTIRRYESFSECPSFAGLKTPDHLQELREWGIHILFKKAVDGSIIVGDSHEYAPVGRLGELGFNNVQYINALMIREANRIVTFDVSAITETWAGYYAQEPQGNLFEHDPDTLIHIRTAIGGKGMTSSCGYAEESIQRLFA